ncbi:hypothetical protein DFH11DRAFT_1637271 [Phellopilus nigrolimitatus]|nr:hypothetical protein DFH11DRAFT_1637271 [Phellopilus nigrolimitatus]
MHAQRTEALALRLSEKEASLSHLRTKAGMLEDRIEELLVSQAQWEVVYEEVQESEVVVPNITHPAANVSASSCAPAYSASLDLLNTPRLDDPFVNNTGGAATANLDVSAESPVLSLITVAEASVPTPHSPPATSYIHLSSSLLESPIPYLTGTPALWNGSTALFTPTAAPRRMLIGLSPGTPTYVFRGRVKAHITQSTHKVLAGKENVIPDLY